jgi:hypothetical protein
MAAQGQIAVRLVKEGEEEVIDYKRASDKKRQRSS